VASIQFTDGGGAVTLTNGMPAPADRFSSWEPLVTEIGAFAHRLGSGTRNSFVFRTDFGARFELRNLPASKLSDAIRCLRWLQDGGTVALNTGDAAGRSYPTCTLAPESTPELRYTPDGPIPQWTLALAVIRTDATPAPMICQYGTYG